MNYFCNAKDFGKTLEKTVSDIQKGCRLAAYKTLEAVAERSRRAVIANYFKKFPDENGIKKNKGVPQQVTKSKVNKEKIEISLFTKDSISFMTDQEYGAVRTPKAGKNIAVPFLGLKQEGRNSKGGMKSSFSIKTVMNKVLKNKSGEGTGRKKFHFAKTKRGRTMIVQEQKGTDDAKEMYHLVPKTKIKPRWDFEKTVKAISSKYIEPTFEKELQKVVDKF